MATEYEAQVVLDAGKAIARAELSHAPALGEGAPYIVLANGAVKSVERFLDAPRRVRATVTARTAQGLIDYVKTHKTSATTVFAWSADNSFMAVIDYHEPAIEPIATIPVTEGSTLTAPSTFPAQAFGIQASWCSHKVQLALALTPDWQRWVAANKKPMGQEEFAAFIEDNTHNIAKPDGGELFEMSRQLHATKSVQFASSVRLDNGQHELRYEETISGSAGKKGQFKVPTEFTLGIAPFEGSALYQVTARFRYRIAQGGALALWFDMLQVEQVLESAFKAEREKIQVGLPGVPVFDAKFGPDVSIDSV